MKLSTKSEMSLKVYTAYSGDPGNGIIRICYDVMDLLGISLGDVAEIKNRGRRTVAKCLRLAPRDEGKGMIRIDGFTRYNLGLGTPKRGARNKDTVTIRKVQAVPAEKVTLAAVGSIPQINEGYLTDYLENVPLIKGHNVIVPYFGGELTLRVIDVTPDDVVIVTQKTAFHISEACFISREEWDRLKKPWKVQKMR